MQGGYERVRPEVWSPQPASLLRLAPRLKWLSPRLLRPSKHGRILARFDSVAEFPGFRALWSASLAAALGQWVQTTALGWLAFDLTGSKSVVRLVALAAGAPYL